MADETNPDKTGTLPDLTGAGTTPAPEPTPAKAAKVDPKDTLIAALQAQLAASQATATLAQLQAPVVGVPQPLSDSDIVATHPELGERGFSDITWKAMETNGEHAGWVLKVDKPTDL